jgi:hypothetical protein
VILGRLLALFMHECHSKGLGAKTPAGCRRYKLHVVSHGKSVSQNYPLVKMPLEVFETPFKVLAR